MKIFRHPESTLIFLFCCLGLINNDLVDFAINSFGWRKDRLELVDYIPMNGPSTSLVYIKNPKDTFDWNVYLTPLTPNAWKGVIIFSLIMPILMTISIADSKYMSIILGRQSSASFDGIILLNDICSLRKPFFRKTSPSVLFMCSDCSKITNYDERYFDS